MLWILLGLFLMFVCFGRHVLQLCGEVLCLTVVWSVAHILLLLGSGANSVSKYLIRVKYSARVRFEVLMAVSYFRFGKS